MKTTVTALLLGIWMPIFCAQEFRAAALCPFSMGFSHALNVSSQPAEDWSGDYTGDINGTPSSLTLLQSADGVRGTIDAGGYVYEVIGNVQGGMLTGQVHDPQTNGNLACQGSISGDQVRLVLNMPDEFTGQKQSVELLFTRSKGHVVAPGGPLAGGAASGVQAGWPGTYSGSLNGTPTTMQLEENGGQISGSIDAGGYRYQVSGTSNVNAFEGQLFDPQTQGTLQCRGSLNGNQAQLVIVNTDQFTAQQQEVRLDFTRGTGGGATAGGAPGAGGSAGVAGYERDPSLIGNWLYSESYTSGDYGFASQWRLIINADGSYLYGDAKVAGGGPGIGGQTGGGDYTRGQWGTRNGTIYINEGYGWQPYAGYYVEGTSMLMKFANGSKQVWKRSY
jgi:hypothetical protein